MSGHFKKRYRLDMELMRSLLSEILPAQSSVFVFGVEAFGKPAGLSERLERRAHRMHDPFKESFGERQRRTAGGMQPGAPAALVKEVCQRSVIIRNAQGEIDGVGTGLIERVKVSVEGGVDQTIVGVKRHALRSEGARDQIEHHNE